MVGARPKFSSDIVDQASPRVYSVSLLNIVRTLLPTLVMIYLAFSDTGCSTKCFNQ